MKRLGEHTSWAEAENGRGEQRREWSRKSESAAVGERRVERNQVETTSLLRLTTYVSHQSARRTGERSTENSPAGTAAQRTVSSLTGWSPQTFTSITAMRCLFSRPAVASTNPILSIFPLSLFFYLQPPPPSQPSFNSSQPPQLALASQFGVVKISCGWIHLSPRRSELGGGSLAETLWTLAMKEGAWYLGSHLNKS